MLCESLRATVSVAMAALPVWSVHHLYGPLPTSYTWGYYRWDVSCVLDKWIDRAHIARLRAGTRFVGSANTCRGVSSQPDFKLHSAPSWFVLRSCFHVQLHDPHNPPTVRTTHMMLDGGTGLTNVVLWDLAYLGFVKHTFSNRTTAWICTKPWANLARYGDPDGPSQKGQRSHGASIDKATTSYAEELEQRFTIWYTVEPFKESYALAPCDLQRMPRGCKVLSSRDTQTFHIQQNLTAFTTHRRTAIALGNLVLADGRTTAPGLDDERQGRHWSHACFSLSRLVVAEEDDDNVEWAWRWTRARPLLPMKTARGMHVLFSRALPPFDPDSFMKTYTD